MSGKPLILSTKALGSALIETAMAEGIVIDEIPFIRIDPISDASLRKQLAGYSSKNITAVFTSSNAVQEVASFVSLPTSWTIYCIGKATQQSVIAFFSADRIQGTAMNARDLSKIIIKEAVQNIVFFCGDRRRDELPVALRKAGIEVEEVVVYKTMLTPSTVAKKYDAILFFSPTAVESFFSMNVVTEDTLIFAVGETTAASARLRTEAKIIIAHNPGSEEMIQLLIEHFKEPTTRTCNN